MKKTIILFGILATLNCYSEYIYKQNINNGINFNEKNIQNFSVVKNGLISQFDARYYTSNLIWSDNIGNKNLIIKDVTYVSETPAHFSFTDNAGQYIYAQEKGFLSGVTDFSLEFWLRLDYDSQTFSFVSNASNTYNNEFMIYKRNHDLIENWISTSSSPTQFAYNDNYWNVGKWVHFVYTRSGNTASYYSNAILAKTHTASTKSFSNEGQLVLGQDQDVILGGFSNADDWPGDIAYFSFYNKALSANEVQTNFNAAKNHFGLN